MEDKAFVAKKALLNWEVRDLKEAGGVLLEGLVKEGRVKPDDLIVTFIGGGVIFLHARDWVKKPLVAYMRPKASLVEDGAQVTNIFLVISPIDDPDAHLIALARLARLMTDPKLKGRLLSAQSSEEVLDLLNENS